MGEAKRNKQLQPATLQAARIPQKTQVSSLLDIMQDGNEYGSIVDSVPDNINLVDDLRRALSDLEAIRGRRCVCYVANLIGRIQRDTGMEAADHLPFNEMVNQIPRDVKDIDVFLVTPGGSPETVIQFVDSLRAKFDSVEFVLPYKAMSAGTLFALSGERIWMDSRAYLGPIDPQVRAKDGTFIPAQALLILLQEIQQKVDEAQNNNKPVPLTYLQLLRDMDQQKLGHALSSTKYVEEIASRYLENYKFRLWEKHSKTQQVVTPEERKQRSVEVAAAICNHQRWKAHGHSIGREEVFKELQIRIEPLEAQAGLERATRRLWALFYYLFDKSPAQKVIFSKEYSYIRSAANAA